jgi:uncharacterized phage protein gp47/JayE
MATPTLIQLFTPLTADQVFASELQIASDVQLPVTAWQPLSCGREVLFVTAQLASNFTVGAFAGAAAGGLLDYATGDWLTLLGISNFGVTRIAATFGAGIVTLTNVAAVDYPFLAGEFVVVNSVTGVAYTNSSDFTLLSGSTVTPTVLNIGVVAETAGTAGQAAPGQITTLQTPQLGVTCTNATAITGTDEQTDASLRALCRLSMARSSPNGPQDAYNYFAITSVRADGQTVGVTRTNVVQLNGSNIVYVASASGAIPGDAFDASTDLGAVNANIQNNCVPTGITATTVSATNLAIALTGTVWRSRGSTASDASIQQAVATQITNYLATVPIGGFNIGSGGQVFLDALIGQVFQALPGQIVQVTLTVPASDTPVNANQVPVPGAINITVMQAP